MRQKLYSSVRVLSAICALLIALSFQFATQEAQEIEYEKLPASANAVDPAMYPFTFGTDSLEDMSAGTTQLLGAGVEFAASAVTDIGFPFSYDNATYTQFSVNASGLMRLGAAVVSISSVNDLTHFEDNPKIAAYWDHICTGTGTGKVHYKLVGTAPNQKLVVEWRDMQIPVNFFAGCGAGTGRFQVWLNANGRIDYVYGGGIPANGSRYSIGLTQAAGVAANSGFASITVPAGGSPTVSYTAANNANQAAIASGTRYSFVLVPPNPNGNFSLSSLNYSGGEGTAAGITVNRSSGTAGAVSVDYSLADGTATGGAACGPGVDFVNAGGTVNFVEGQATQTFPVSLCSDAFIDAGESFNVTLSSPTGGAALGLPVSATVTLIDATPVLRFSSSSFVGSENNGGAIVTVTRATSNAGTVTVDYATATGGTATGGASCTAGVDFISPSGTLVFADGDTIESFDITICNDSPLSDSNETFNLALSNPTGGAAIGDPNTVSVTIADNTPALQFGTSAYTAIENTTPFNVNVVRIGSTAEAVSVTY